jgi:hypothetical protein
MRARPLCWLRSQMRAADRCRGDNKTVTLRRLLRPERPLGLGRNEATPQEALRALKRALERQKKRLALAEAEAADVQLLGQVTSAAEWPKLLAYWERRNPSGVASWPRRLDSGDYALNLWPLPWGSVARAAGLGADVRKRQPKKMLSAPGLTRFDPEKGSDMTTALAVVCATWLEDVGTTDFQALRLAPPVLEAWAPGGRLISRAVVDFDLDWSLPAADGI